MTTNGIPGVIADGWLGRALVMFFANPRRGLARCLDRRFTHVEVVVQVAGDKSGRRAAGEWVTISPGTAGFCVYRGSGTAAQVFRRASALDNVSGVFWADVHMHPVGTWGWLAPFTCVKVAKRVLGLRRPFILTPAQLHNHLTRETPS